MNKPYLKYIGPIKVSVLRDYVLRSQLSETDTIILNTRDFDELALDYREFYNDHMPEPFLELGVLIKEDTEDFVPLGRVAILEDDTESIRVKVPVDPFDPEETIYRCGWCGNVVDYDGREFDPETRLYKIGRLQQFSGRIRSTHVNGYCCSKEWA